MSLGTRIQQYRRAANLSQEQLAERMGVSRQAVSKWELGETIPDADRIIQLAQIFGVTTDALLIDRQSGSSAAIPVGASPAADWPGRIGRLFRQKGYIAGYLIAGYAAFALLITRLAHFGFSQILRIPLELSEGQLPAELAFPLVFTNIISLVAALFMIGGIVLALVWKKRSGSAK